MFLYNSNLLKTIDLLGNTTEFEYNQNGNRISQTDGRGRETTYQYDKNDQLTKTVYPDSSEVKFTYDGLGRLTKMIDQHSTWTYQYDELGHLIETTNPPPVTPMLHRGANGGQASYQRSKVT